MSIFDLDKKPDAPGRQTSTVSMTLTVPELKHYFKIYCIENQIKDGDAVTKAIVDAYGPELEKIAAREKERREQLRAAG